jgi:hypothetical protein
MTPDISNWRASPNYDYIDRLVAPDLAWEWLRRNSEYQHDYSKVEGQKEESELLVNAVRRRWGLQFPCPPYFHRR